MSSDGKDKLHEMMLDCSDRQLTHNFLRLSKEEKCRALSHVYNQVGKAFELHVNVAALKDIVPMIAKYLTYIEVGKLRQVCKVFERALSEFRGAKQQEYQRLLYEKTIVSNVTMSTLRQHGFKFRNAHLMRFLGIVRNGVDRVIQENGCNGIRCNDKSHKLCAWIGKNRKDLYAPWNYHQWRTVGGRNSFKNTTLTWVQLPARGYSVDRSGLVVNKSRSAVVCSIYDDRADIEASLVIRMDNDDAGERMAKRRKTVRNDGEIRDDWLGFHSTNLITFKSRKDRTLTAERKQQLENMTRILK